MTKTEQIDDNGEMDENTFIYAIDRSSNKAYSVSGNSVDLFAPNAYEGHNVNYTTELKSGGDYSVWANYCGLGDIDDCDPVSDLNHLLKGLLVSSSYILYHFKRSSSPVSGASFIRDRFRFS